MDGMVMIGSDLEVDSSQLLIKVDLGHLAPILRPLFCKQETVLYNVFTYLDFPNFHREELSFFRLNFFGLQGVLNVYQMPGLNCVRSSKIYFKPHHSLHDEKWDFFERMRLAGFQVLFSLSANKDVDPLIVEDIAALRSFEGNICLNLVSGDADYLILVKNLKEHQESLGYKVHLRIFSWSDQLNPLWKELADQIIYLDDVVRFFDKGAKHAFPPIDLDYALLEKYEK